MVIPTKYTREIASEHVFHPLSHSIHGPIGTTGEFMLELDDNTNARPSGT
jgi:hypothetical protein